MKIDLRPKMYVRMRLFSDFQTICIHRGIYIKEELKEKPKLQLNLADYAEFCVIAPSFPAQRICRQFKFFSFLDQRFTKELAVNQLTFNVSTD